jgi:hypothetical protein
MGLWSQWVPTTNSIVCGIALAPAPALEPPDESCEDLLAQLIDTYLTSYVGWTRKGSPLAGLTGAYFVQLGILTGVDPAFILGIARAESSLATASPDRMNGGQFNVYGNSAHFYGGPLPPYTSYWESTSDDFNRKRPNLHALTHRPTHGPTGRHKLSRGALRLQRRPDKVPG